MIFFDIDDTLLDYKSSQDKAAYAFAKSHPTYIEYPDAFPELWDQITQRNMTRYLTGELTFQEQRRCRINEALGLHLSPDDADTLFDTYYQIYEDCWSLFPEVPGVLSRLRDQPDGIITNGDKFHQTYKLQKLGIQDVFAVLVTPACAGAAKPHSEIF